MQHMVCKAPWGVGHRWKESSRGQASADLNVDLDLHLWLHPIAACADRDPHIRTIFLFLAGVQPRGCYSRRSPTVIHKSEPDAGAFPERRLGMQIQTHIQMDKHKIARPWDKHKIGSRTFVTVHLRHHQCNPTMSPQTCYHGVYIANHRRPHGSWKSQKC